MKLDLHGYTLEEAIDLIFKTFRQMLSQKITSLEIIHGHLHGTRIRDYLDSSLFTENCNAEGIRIIKSQRHSKGGATTFIIVLPPGKIIFNKKDPNLYLKELRRKRKIVL